MIPEYAFHYLHLMQQAAANNDLGVTASTIAATRETVAIIIAKDLEGGCISLVPLGLLVGQNNSHTNLLHNGRLTQEAIDAFEQFKADLIEPERTAWLDTNVVGRVTVTHGGRRARHAPEGLSYQCILPWDDPYKLFTSPMTDESVPANETASHLH
jgi:hypothetical protein